MFPIVIEEILEVQISDLENDELIWDGNVNGEVSVKAAYEFYMDKSLVMR